MTVATLAGLALSFTPPYILARLLFMGALGATAAIFRTLTVEVDDENISWYFGNGFPKSSLPLSDITSVHVIRTTPSMGWGIHHVGNGWLYNIYGLDAVELCLDEGKRTLIGTDDAEKLQTALELCLTIKA
ncbi:MAG: hypothetical protein K8F91_16590 [Candidatus Obscuribacterales bacterium]|nr:hypothetical protein [Candidatus Obscuribacterales bacterium]